MAQSGHCRRCERCPLSGVKRTLSALGILQKFHEAKNRNLKLDKEHLLEPLTGQFSIERAICSKKS
jgi:hypothetical protein